MASPCSTALSSVFRVFVFWKCLIDVARSERRPGCGVKPGDDPLDQRLSHRKDEFLIRRG